MLLKHKRPEKGSLGRWRADLALARLSECIFSSKQEDPREPTVQINLDPEKAVKRQKAGHMQYGGYKWLDLITSLVFLVFSSKLLWPPFLECFQRVPLLRLLVFLIQNLSL